TMLPTMRRATGATISTIGKAISQDGSQAPSQRLPKPSIMPAVRAVEMPETTRDIRADKTKPKATWAKRGDSIDQFPFGWCPQTYPPCADCGTRMVCTSFVHLTPCHDPLWSRPMARPDLNLLVTLDVLLAEGSVARAARRLRLSPSAMSRALARLRTATGDPLLVRAGRGLVPTPRALELRGRVGSLVQDAQAVLRPAASFDLAPLVRTFTLRTSEGF